ncbi:MAG: VWA domain-containing protein [Acidobacteria bacterium]|nr:VWA domain-containing protein [Acidobacteriota bacterium]
MRVFFAVLAAGALLAQQAAPPADDGKPTVFRLDTRIVVCHTTVVDKTGHLVTNLPESAFSVYENKVRQQIRRFKREDVPVSLGLVIDNSGSMRDKLAQVKAAAVALVRESNPQDEVFVVNFNDSAYLDNPKNKPFTSDINELQQALAKIDTRGGTAMRDAIQMSIDHLKGAHRDKKVLVVITDGNDNSSTVGMDTILRSAHKSDVLIYGVGLLAEEEHREASRARKALNDLAEATGGKTFFPKDVAEVDTIARQVAHDIRNQYVIEYSPSNSVMDGTFRAIKITARAPGTTVRTRSGYYATPDSK